MHLRKAPPAIWLVGRTDGVLSEEGRVERECFAFGFGRGDRGDGGGETLSDNKDRVGYPKLRTRLRLVDQLRGQDLLVAQPLGEPL